MIDPKQYQEKVSYYDIILSLFKKVGETFGVNYEGITISEALNKDLFSKLNPAEISPQDVDIVSALYLSNVLKQLIEVIPSSNEVVIDAMAGLSETFNSIRDEILNRVEEGSKTLDTTLQEVIKSKENFTLLDNKVNKNIEELSKKIKNILADDSLSKELSALSNKQSSNAALISDFNIALKGIQDELKFLKAEVKKKPVPTIITKGTGGITSTPAYNTQSPILFKKAGTAQGSGGTVSEINFTGNVNVTRTNNSLEVNIPDELTDILEYVNLAGFPETGESGKIYIAKDTNKTYRWSGSAYVEVGGGGGGGGTWGSITGTLSSQTDLQSSLDAKANTSHTHTKSQITDFAHNHTKADITDFAHTHTKADITDFAHTHTIGDVTGLQTALDSKQATLGFTPENVANKGVANGYASLDTNAKIPTSQLPSYVDDVLEYTDLASLPVTGENGKIYITLDTNKTYRWSGSAYVEISSSLALGTTSSTAFQGDLGQIAYTHTSRTDNPHSVTKAQVGLANVDNTSDVNKPISTATQTALDGKANTSHTHTISNVTGLQSALDAKQDTLVSGTSIKTVNGNSLLGSGDITISSGGSISVGEFGETPVSSVTKITTKGITVTDKSSGEVEIEPGGDNITDLTALTSPSSDDLLLIVDDPAGTPVSKKTTIGDVYKAFIKTGTTTTAAATAAKVVTLDSPWDTYTPVNGDLFWITYSGVAQTASNATLNINGTGAKNVRLANANATNVGHQTAAGGALLYLYNGTVYNLVGSQQQVDTNTTYQTNTTTTVVTATTQAAAINTSYVANNAAQVNFTLPATAAVGSLVRIAGLGAGGWKITAAASDTIMLNNTSSAPAGYINSTGQYDSALLMCTVANTTWAVIHHEGRLAMDGVLIPDLAAVTPLFTTTSTATITHNGALYQKWILTAQTAALTIANSSNTNVGDSWSGLVSTASAQTLSFGTDYVGISGLALPTTTTAGKWMELIFTKVTSSKVLVSYVIEG